MKSALSLVAAIFVVGCSDSTAKTESTSTGPTAGPVMMTTPDPKASPIDAQDAAKECGFPLMPNPLKNPIATKTDKGKGEFGYEIDQVVKATPKEAADFYAKKLSINAVEKDGVYDLDGQTPNGLFILMHIQTVDGKTAIVAPILRADGAK